LDQKNTSETVAAQGTSVFLSYSRKNIDLKRIVEASLRAAGYETRSDEDIVEGDDYRSRIARLIQSSTVTVVLWTHEAFLTRWIADEAHLADELANRDGRTRYIGVIIDPVLERLPFPLANRKNLDLAQEGLTEMTIQSIIAVIARFSSLSSQEVQQSTDVTFPAASVAGSLDGAAKELQFYNDSVQVGTAQALQSYLQHFPKGAHREAATERLADLTHPVRRFRKRLIGLGAALVTVLGLSFAAYPVIKDLVTPPTNLADASEPLRDGLRPPGLLATPSVDSSVPAPASTSDTFPPQDTTSLLTPKLELEPAAPVVPLVEVEVVDIDSLPEVAACDGAAGSAGWERELIALGRPVVLFDNIEQDTAIAACEGALALVPDNPRIRHQLARAFHKAAATTDPTLYAKAAEYYELNCRLPGVEGPPSCANLGGLYAEAQVGSVEDTELALEFYQRGCDNGDAQSCGLGASLLRDEARADVPQSVSDDLGASQDPCEATATCERGLALHKLGKTAEDGEMTGAPDLETATRQYIAACEVGLTLGCSDQERLQRGIKAKGLLEAAEEMARTGCDMPERAGVGYSCNILGLMFDHAEIGNAQNETLALTAFEKACDMRNARGCSNAAIVLGRSGDPKDHNRAANLGTRGCNMASDNGQGASCNSLGNVLNNSAVEGFSPDPAAALEAYVKACDLSYDWGCANAAIFLRKPGPMEDRPKAAGLAAKGCKTGDLEGAAAACNVLGYMYEKGETGGVADPSGALGFYQIACDGGNAIGCSNAAVVLKNNDEIGTAQDALKAAELACALPPSYNSGKGCEILGDLLYKGLRGLTVDIPRGLAAYSTACDRSYAYGCNSAVQILRKVETVKDLPRAAELAEKACGLAPQEGSARGCNLLGVMRQNGEVTGTTDLPGAEEAYRKACDAGYAWGCANAVQVILQQSGSDTWSGSLELAKKGCEMDGSDGQAEACGAAASLYWSEDRFSAENFELAINLYMKSCSLGDAWSCTNAIHTSSDGYQKPEGFDPVALLQTGCGLDGASGQANACVALGYELKMQSDDTPTEPVLAAFAKACELDDPEGCEILGRTLWTEAAGIDEMLRVEAALLTACALEQNRCPVVAGLYRLNSKGFGFLPSSMADAYLAALRAGDDTTLAFLLEGKANGEVVEIIQANLGNQGSNIGAPDGKMGPKTRAALEALCDCAE
jgi:uncharacterized protein